MKDFNRREFIKTTAAVTAATMASPLMASKKSTVGEDYKAIVCVLLEGGADSFNMVVPKDASTYAKYKEARPEIAVARDKLRTLKNSNYGFHPDMPRMQRMFNHKNLAVIANVGTLTRPVSRSEVKAIKRGEVILGLPNQLFSHVDQRDMWMSTGVETSGWAARVADEFGTDHTNISAGGQNVMQQGGAKQSFIAHDDVFGLIEDPQGIMKKLKRLGVDVSFEKDDTQVGKSLGEQLEMVAKLIEARKDANFPSRQIYFVRYDGWDSHEREKDNLIDHLDRSLGAFAVALEQLGLSDKVTTFTTSDFGRTITTNGKGVDHGWGGHAFAFGGAVNAGIYGQMPKIERNSPDALANNAVVPTTSVEQYMATLVEWLGDGKVDLEKVFPNLASFDKKSLGFMA
jgi:uncharacterized protein (DUF1501 family)